MSLATAVSGLQASSSALCPALPARPSTHPTNLPFRRHYGRTAHRHNNLPSTRLYVMRDDGAPSPNVTHQT